MRRRSQKPRIRNKGGYWITQYRDLDGRKRKVSLGPVAKTKKLEAELLEPININSELGRLVRHIYLLFYRRKWKASTISSNEQHVNSHLLGRSKSASSRASR